jgi:hypothetical protein
MTRYYRPIGVHWQTSAPYAWDSTSAARDEALRNPGSWEFVDADARPSAHTKGIRVIDEINRLWARRLPTARALSEYERQKAAGKTTTSRKLSLGTDEPPAPPEPPMPKMSRAAYGKMVARRQAQYDKVIRTLQEAQAEQAVDRLLTKLRGQ